MLERQVDFFATLLHIRDTNEVLAYAAETVIVKKWFFGKQKKYYGIAISTRFGTYRLLYRDGVERNRCLVELVEVLSNRDITSYTMLGERVGI